MDTPERGEPCFEEATERFRELAGDRVRIEFGPRSEDRYGRALFYVYTEAGESVAEKLIREGLGKAWERDGQHRDLPITVEDGAERNSLSFFAVTEPVGEDFEGSSITVPTGANIFQV